MSCKNCIISFFLLESSFASLKSFRKSNQFCMKIMIDRILFSSENPIYRRVELAHQRLMMEADDLQVFGRPFARMQILAVQEIFDGVRFDILYPVDKRTNRGILISSGVAN